MHQFEVSVVKFEVAEGFICESPDTIVQIIGLVMLEFCDL